MLACFGILYACFVWMSATVLQHHMQMLRSRFGCDRLHSLCPGMSLPRLEHAAALENYSCETDTCHRNSVHRPHRSPRTGACIGLSRPDTAQLEKRKTAPAMGSLPIAMHHFMQRRRSPPATVCQPLTMSRPTAEALARSWLVKCGESQVDLERRLRYWLVSPAPFAGHL